MTTDKLMIYCYKKTPPKPKKEHTMNQDLTHRFLILIDRRQQSPTAVLHVLYRTIPKYDICTTFNSVLDRYYFFSDFSFDKNSLHKKPKYNEE